MRRIEPGEWPESVLLPASWDVLVKVLRGSFPQGGPERGLPPMGIHLNDQVSANFKSLAREGFGIVLSNQSEVRAFLVGAAFVYFTVEYNVNTQGRDFNIALIAALANAITVSGKGAEIWPKQR